MSGFKPYTRGPDTAVLKQSIEVSKTGMKQAIHALECGSKEVIFLLYFIYVWPWKITLKFRDLDLIVLINIWINRKCMKATVYHTDLKWKFHSECFHYEFCMLLVFLGGRKNICNKKYHENSTQSQILNNIM